MQVAEHRGVRIGDRFYEVRWNTGEHDELWIEVTDIWFDPVRGQNSETRGWCAGVRLMGRGDKRTLTIGALLGRGYRRVDEDAVRAKINALLENLRG